MTCENRRTVTAGPLAINTATLPFFRFFAACVVAFFHFGQKISWYPQLPAIFKAGSLMVTFFFVLSGFSLFLGYFRSAARSSSQQDCPGTRAATKGRGEGGGPPKAADQGRDLPASFQEFRLQHYWIKRAIKIFPLYYLAFFLSAGLWAYQGQLTPLEFLLNLFCLQSWFPNPLSLNFTSWFVSALLSFYAAFPFILSFLQKTRPKGHHLLLASALLWGMTQGVLTLFLNSDLYRGYPSWHADLIHYFPLSHFCSFFMGICGAYVLVTKERKAKRGGPLSALFTLAFLLAIALMVQYQSDFEQIAGLDLPFATSFYAPLMLLFLLHLTRSRNFFLDFLASTRFVIWGEVSYALFILQAPLDRLYKYLVPASEAQGPALHFALFSLFLLAFSVLATMAEKRAGHWIVSRITKM